MVDRPPHPAYSGQQPAAANERLPRRRSRLLLIISLCFNLVILGVAGGHILSRVVYGPRVPEGALGFGPFTEALAPEDRRALVREFFQQARGFSADRAAMRSDFETLVTALKTVPYDPSVFEAVMARQKSRSDAWLALGQKLLMARVAAMTPDARAAFADRLKTELTHRHHRPPQGADR